MEKEEKNETNELEKTDTFEKFQAVQGKKKSHIGLVLFLILIILGLVGYICYDKGVFDSLLGKSKTVEKSKQEEKLSEEEVMKLHDSLILDDETGGVYHDNKKIVNIESVDNNSFIIFAISNYIRDNNLSISNKSGIKPHYDYESCTYIEPLTIKEDDLNNYIKDKYKTTRTFLYDKSKLSLAESDNCRTIGHFYTTGMHTNFYFDLSDNSYKIIKNQHVESVCGNDNDTGIFHNKFIKSSQSNVI